jgi:membrane protein implicated in regulation of membrane protease activity
MELETSIAIILIVIGVLMLLLELSSPGYFFLVPAATLIILGAVGLLVPGFLLSWASPILAVLIIIPTALINIKLYQKLSPPAPPETTVATSLVGMKGVVTTKIIPNTLKGKVKIANDIWSATSTCHIEVGKHVRVIASEGVHVKVEEIAEDGSAVCKEG